MIYHLTTAAEWKEAQEQGIYVAPSLETEGFIHCSREEQVAGVAERFFAKKKNLVLLHINEHALDAELKYEEASNGVEPAGSLSETYPHIYGAINLEAVTKAEPYTPAKPQVARECVACRKMKALLECGVCQDPVCKDCEEFLEPGSFDFRESVPVELAHTHYCPSCFAEHVETAREEYGEQMEQAKAAYFFFTTQKREIPVLKRAQREVVIQGADRNEVILRLAFRAVEQGFNAIVQGEVTHEKIRDEGYQKTLWTGKGLPVTVDSIRLESRVRKGYIEEDSD